MTVKERGGSDKPVARRIGVLVLGMHRSGTSALTRVLSLLGCDLPRTLMIANESNETGHWESDAIMNLNDQILQSAGSNWQDWLELNPGWHTSPKAAEFKEKALTVLEEEFGRSSLFVLKDPRICRFVPFWLDVLEAAGVEPVVVTQVRNPLEIAGSLSRRDGLEPALGHLLWLRHVLEAEAGSRGRARFHSSYEELLNGWPQLVSEMQSALNLSWPRMSATANDEIGGFLTEKLRHHVEPARNVSRNPLLSAWLRDAFAIFSRWAEDGESEADYPELDRIKAELNGAAPAFTQLIISGRKRAEELKTAQRSVEEHRQKLTALTAEQQSLAEALGKANEERAQVEAELRRQVGETQTRLSEIQDELSRTQSALAQRSAEADEVTAQLRQSEEALNSLRDQHAEELEAQRNSANAEIEKLRVEKGTAETRLTERFSELAAMTRMLKDMEGELEASARRAKEKEAAAQQSQDRANWLREVSEVMLNGSAPDPDRRSLKGRLSGMMRAPTWKRQNAQLKESGIFDPDAYLAANPDVAEAGFDPLRHYIIHGIREGRKLQ